MKGVMGRFVRGLGSGPALGEDLIENPDDSMAADRTAEGDVITHTAAPAQAALVSADGVLGFSWPVVLAVAAGAWFLFKGK